MYVEGDVADGQVDSGRPPVKIAGVDVNGVVQSLKLGTDGALAVSSASTSSDTPVLLDAVTGKTLIRNSAGVLGGVYSVYNPNGVDLWLQVFDAASTAAVTLGSTAPKLTLWLPASSAYDASYARPVAFASGIVVAPTTSYKGSTAPSLGVYGSVGHATT